jgi:hypothetical protein
MYQGRSTFRYARMTFGMVCWLVLAAVAPPSRADVEVGATLVNANSFYRFGTSAGTAQAVVVSDPVTQQPGDSSGRDVEAVLTVPAFTPPTGAAGDTFFRPATVRAFQTPEGFNATSVDAAIANGLAFTEFVAETTWTQIVQVTNLFGLRTNVDLEYLLFPGAVGLSSFGSADRVARVSSSIRVSFLDTGLFKDVSDSSMELRQVAGSLFPVATSSGDLASSPLTLSSETRNGLNHTVAKSDPFFGVARIGTFESDSAIAISYTLRASLTMPGFEMAGFANIGDPFELASDPDAFIVSQFPGLENFQFSVREVPAPVPLPGAWVLLASALAFLGVCRRREGALAG